MSSVSSVTFEKEIKFEKLLFSCPSKNCNHICEQFQSLIKHIECRINPNPKVEMRASERKDHVDMVNNRLKGNIFCYDENMKKYVFNPVQEHRNQFSDYCKMKYLFDKKNIPFDHDLVLRDKKSDYKCPWCSYTVKKINHIKEHILKKVNLSIDSEDKFAHVQQVVRCIAFKKDENGFSFNKDLQMPFSRFCMELHHRAELKEPLYHPPFLQLLLLFPESVAPEPIKNGDGSNVLTENLDSGIPNDWPDDVSLAQQLLLDPNHILPPHTTHFQDCLGNFTFEEFPQQTTDDQSERNVIMYNSSKEGEKASTNSNLTFVTAPNPKRRCVRKKRS